MEILPIHDMTGIDSRPICATLWQAGKSPSSRLAVALPGYSYPVEAPVMFYLKLAFVKNGWDWLGIDYRYNENTAFLQLSQDDQEVYFEQEVGLIARYIVDKFTGRQLVTVAKSLGTSALHHMLTSTRVPEVFASLGHVILTPANRFEDLVTTIEKSRDPVIAAIGNDDPYYDESLMSRLQARNNTRTITVERSGHLFEDTGHDLEQSIKNLVPIVGSVEEAIRDGFFEAQH